VSSGFNYPDAATSALQNAASFKQWLVEEKDVGSERVVGVTPNALHVALSITSPNQTASS
jgi:hypothetical protein